MFKYIFSSMYILWAVVLAWAAVCTTGPLWFVIIRVLLGVGAIWSVVLAYAAWQDFKALEG